MIDLDFIKEVTSFVGKETKIIRKALILKPPTKKYILLPESVINIDDFEVVSILEMKNYPPYLSISKDEVYLFFNVNCDVGGDYLCRFGRTLKIEGWVNNHFIYCSNTDNQKYLCLINLNKGDNYFLLKIKKIEDTCSLLDFTFRIDYFNEFVKTSEYGLLDEYLKDNIINSINIMSLTSDKYYSFYIIPYDYVNINIDLEFFVEVKREFETIFTKSCRLFEKIKYKKELLANGLYTINVTYTLNDKLYTKSEIIDLKKNIPLILSKSENRLRRISLDINEYNLQLKGLIKFYRFNSQLCENSDYKAFILNQLNDLLYSSNIFFNSGYIQYIKDNGGYFPVSFNSRYDSMIYSYLIYVPTGYDETKKYSLVLAFPYFDDRPDLLFTMFNKYNKKKDKEDAIFVLIDPLGQTMGSYIGDVAINDCIEHIKKFFSVNIERIYGIGYSIGSYTLFSFAQNYPDLFSALYLCSGEYILDTIENLKNIPIVFISSLLDQNMVINKYKILINDNSYNKIKYFISDYDYHRSLSLYFCHISTDNLSLLLSKEKKYPYNMSFSTFRLFHNKAYGVEILEQDEYKNKSTVSYTAQNGIMKLNTENVKTMKLTVPLNLFHKILYLGESIMVEKDKVNSFIFQKNKGHIKITNVNENNNITVIDLKHINIGIFYVFMDNLKILYSEECDEILDLACKLQRPKLFMRNDESISVEFKKYNLKNLNLSDIKSNIIIIEREEKNPLIRNLNKYYDLDFDEEGFIFNGKQYLGNYSIMRLYTNPYYDRYKILVIYTNQSIEFKKNMFLRNFSIPSYTYGIHPLNKNNIICYNNRYFLSY